MIVVKSRWKDKMKGGKADKKKPQQFNKKDLDEGAEHETEHTVDSHTAKEIAMDHLTEDPKYYKKLKRLEKSEGHAYYGPMTAADINLVSWNEFFREGGSLTQPSWLQVDKFKNIQKEFVRQARYHNPSFLY